MVPTGSHGFGQLTEMRHVNYTLKSAPIGDFYWRRFLMPNKYVDAASVQMTVSELDGKSGRVGAAVTS